MLALSELLLLSVILTAHSQKFIYWNLNASPAPFFRQCYSVAQADLKLGLLSLPLSGWGYRLQTCATTAGVESQIP